MDEFPVIIRLTEPKRRTMSDIESELHWIDYLSREGMQVANPIPNIEGSFVILLPGVAPFYVAVFHKAKGQRLREKVEFSEGMLKIWGRYVGRLQRLTLKYVPPKDVKSRPHWEAEDAMIQAMRSFESAPKLAQERMNELLTWLRQLPTPKSAFGLIHADLHHGNFMVENGVITAFDFDDCCMHWFIYDLTPAILSILWDSSERNLGLTYDTISSPLLAGYLEEMPLEDIWVRRLPIFLKFRSILLYHWIRTGLMEGLFDDRGKDWCESRLTECLKEMKEPLRLL